MPVQISKKRKFVQDGVFKAELNEFLTRELAEDGYSGVEVSTTMIVVCSDRLNGVIAVMITLRRAVDCICLYSTVEN